MSAVNKKQAIAKPGSQSAQIAGSMKPADVNEYAGTPQRGLPMRKTPRVVSKGITRMPFKK